MTKKHIILGVIMVVLVLLYVAKFSGMNIGGVANLPTNARIEAEKATVRDLQVKLAELYKKKSERDDFRHDLVDRTAPFWRVTGDSWPTTDVQTRVERLALRTGVKLTRVGAPQVKDLGDELHAIEVQISTVTSIKAFSEFAGEVENHKPMLVWEQCNIRPNKLKDPDSIMVQGRVRAYVLSESARAYLRGEPVVVAEDKKMKAVLAIISLLLTAAAVVLTGQVLKPPTPIQDKGTRPDPEPQLSDRKSQPAAIGAGVVKSEMERFYRQNLFHPDRKWEDPDRVETVDPDAGAGGEKEEETPESDAENFELIGILKMGERATAVIRILPPKPKPVVRTRTSRGIPIRSSRTPVPAAPKKAEETTHVYALGKPIEETGYTLTKVELESVELTRDVDSSIITLYLDKLDDGSRERRKGAQSAAAVKAKAQQAQQAKIAAAQRAAQQKSAGVTKLPPSGNSSSTPKPPTKTTKPATPTSPAANAAAQSAEERAKRLEQIREQFRKRLEERRTTQ